MAAASDLHGSGGEHEGHVDRLQLVADGRRQRFASRRRAVPDRRPAQAAERQRHRVGHRMIERQVDEDARSVAGRPTWPSRSPEAAQGAVIAHVAARAVDVELRPRREAGRRGRQQAGEAVEQRRGERSADGAHRGVGRRIGRGPLRLVELAPREQRRERPRRRRHREADAEPCRRQSRDMRREERQRRVLR